MAFIGSDVIAAVQAWWAGTPAVSSLTPDGKLWHKVRPEGDSMPYATVFLVSEAPEMWTTGYAWSRTSVQINCHADTDIQARTMALAVRAALGKTPAQPSGSPLVVGEQDAVHVLPDGDGIDIGDGLGPGGRDCWVAFETFDIPWTT